MKITIFLNHLNHHQLPLCLELSEKLGDNFRFVACEKIRQERLDLGFEDLNHKYDFIIRAYESLEQYEFSLDLAATSDVIIIGSAPEIYVDIALKNNKIIMRYSERLLKNGLYRRFIPSTNNKVKSKYRSNNKNIYTLCASAYTAYDLSLFNINRPAFKWGYFPCLNKYEKNSLIKKKNNSKIQILWVGRFIKLKHPEKAIYVAKYLKNKKLDFHLNFIGSGKLEKKLNYMVKKYQLEEYISFLGVMSPEKVRKFMEESNIFLFTSDYREGWGAVLNEAMNSGCAVVASHAIGSVPYLIKHNHNGLIYSNNDLKSLKENVYFLVKNKEYCIQMGLAGYDTLIETWNAKRASQNLIKLCNGLIDNKNIDISEGPGSRASILKNNWYKG